jgi:putative addiction module component (TIGR02574 family)
VGRISYSWNLEVLLMTQAAKDIVNAAIQLPEDERVEIVEQLLVSLEAETDEDADAAWAAEVERRSSEIKQGVVRPVSWEDVKSRARKRVGRGT